jgi:hypothetical protein
VHRCCCCLLLLLRKPLYSDAVAAAAVNAAVSAGALIVCTDVDSVRGRSNVTGSVVVVVFGKTVTRSPISRRRSDGILPFSDRWTVKMPIRRGHVAPQNTFIDTIIRKFDGQSESLPLYSFLLLFLSLDTLCEPDTHTDTRASSRRLLAGRTRPWDLHYSFSSVTQSS